MSERVIKPDAATAMAQLILNVRRVIPFDMPEAQICGGRCIGCPKKLLSFLEGEIESWQIRLDGGHPPNLGELNRFGAICRKVYTALQRNQLVP